MALLVALEFFLLVTVLSSSSPLSLFILTFIAIEHRAARSFASIPDVIASLLVDGR